MAQKIKKGDEVQILVGKDKGERGEVLKVFPKESKVLVRGVNNVKRHTRPSPGQEGGIMTKEMPLHLSNVALVDPSDDKPVRVGFKIMDDGRKVRVSRRTGEVLDQA